MIFGGFCMDNTNFYFKKVNEPKIDGEYFQYDKDRNIMFPCVVTDGQYYGQHGVSNFWYYKNLQTGKEESGYGCFFEKKEYNGDYDTMLP